MKIFISYRRSDTRHLAGRLSDCLRQAKNVDQVFIDVESIAPGALFETEMLRELREADICLALMGSGWAAGERIHNEGDPVRLEVAAALAEAQADSLKLTPVLVDGAPMPSADDLPPDLKALTSYNGLSLRYATFKSDLEHLGEQLNIDLTPETTTKDVVIRTAYGLGISLVAFFFLSILHRALLNRSLETSLGSTSALIAAFFAVLFVGAALPNVWVWAKRLS